MADKLLSKLEALAGSLQLPAPETAISEDGTLTLDGVSGPASDKVSIATQSKGTVSYSLGSLFLLLVDPGGSLVKYRKHCEKYGISDSVKVLEKAAVLEHFSALASVDSTPSEPLTAEAEQAKGDQEASDDDALEKDDKERHRKESRRSSKDRHERKHHSSRDTKDRGSARKKEKTPITNEQLMANLSTVVDKRVKDLEAQGKQTSQDPLLKDPVDDDEAPVAELLDTEAPSLIATEGDGTLGGIPDAEEEQRALIKACLSAQGFEVNTTAIESDRVATEAITALEIPVGNSASVLRAGAGGETVKAAGNLPSGGGDVIKKDFSRILDLYNESLKADSQSRKGSSSSGQKRGPSDQTSSSDAKRVRNMGKSNKKPVGLPLILIPNAMTSPITMINAKEFFGSAKFIPRDVQLKNGVRKLPSVTFTRRIAGRLGGHMVEYEVMDNPSTRLKPHEWDRVVAVIPQGAAWQFKGWRYSNPVDIFNKSYGFYIGIEKTPIPKDLTGWRVKKGWLNKDKRSLDSVTYASFWNGLDDWMSLHKPEYFPSEDN
mmetsp:Transcript_613/g.1109  ORF Transcript_613/g.1109 Transcript_613/m.1109 type:complete len:546 (-) Transcript_613:103-1740(-)|eukprot:CAMPEP_0198305398 /NCGR_PEP_ID=MMETSP1449-20131203/57886_1 /TAXON_ID=420275 /ORGANISM="Attheya septentrionalis, Strain CCMP2084" /LENGTH=545 /DNA_ID=CAMNT_0044007931 /DNA_START=12 /DNA_END=1649 /DNA_ORIENTATION=-